MTNNSKYPECEKLQSVHEESQTLGFFPEWLKNRYTLCHWMESWADEDGYHVPEGYYPDYKSIQNILAEYFDIDMNKVDNEIAEILKEIRNHD